MNLSNSLSTESSQMFVTLRKDPEIVHSFSLIIALHRAHFADALCDSNLHNHI